MLLLSLLMNLGFAASVVSFPDQDCITLATKDRLANDVTTKVIPEIDLADTTKYTETNPLSAKKMIIQTAVCAPGETCDATRSPKTLKLDTAVKIYMKTTSGTSRQYIQYERATLESTSGQYKAEIVDKTVADYVLHVKDRFRFTTYQNQGCFAAAGSSAYYDQYTMKSGHNKATLCKDLCDSTADCRYYLYKSQNSANQCSIHYTSCAAIKTFETTAQVLGIKEMAQHVLQNDVEVFSKPIKQWALTNSGKVYTRPNLMKHTAKIIYTERGRSEMFHSRNAEGSNINVDVTDGTITYHADVTTSDKQVASGGNTISTSVEKFLYRRAQGFLMVDQNTEKACITAAYNTKHLECDTQNCNPATCGSSRCLGTMDDDEAEQQCISICDADNSCKGVFAVKTAGVKKKCKLFDSCSQQETSNSGVRGDLFLKMTSDSNNLALGEVVLQRQKDFSNTDKLSIRKGSTYYKYGFSTNANEKDRTVIQLARASVRTCNTPEVCLLKPEDLCNQHSACAWKDDHGCVKDEEECILSNDANGNYKPKVVGDTVTVVTQKTTISQSARKRSAYMMDQTASSVTQASPIDTKQMTVRTAKCATTTTCDSTARDMRLNLNDQVKIWPAVVSGQRRHMVKYTVAEKNADQKWVETLKSSTLDDYLTEVQGEFQFEAYRNQSCLVLRTIAASYDMTGSASDDKLCRYLCQKDVNCKYYKLKLDTAKCNLFHHNCNHITTFSANNQILGIKEPSKPVLETPTDSTDAASTQDAWKAPLKLVVFSNNGEVFSKPNQDKNTALIAFKTKDGQEKVFLSKNTTGGNIDVIIRNNGNIKYFVTDTSAKQVPADASGARHIEMPVEEFIDQRNQEFMTFAQNSYQTCAGPYDLQNIECRYPLASTYCTTEVDLCRRCLGELTREESVAHCVSLCEDKSTCKAVFAVTESGHNKRCMLYDDCSTMAQTKFKGDLIKRVVTRGSTDPDLERAKLRKQPEANKVSIRSASMSTTRAFSFSSNPQEKTRLNVLLDQDSVSACDTSADCLLSSSGSTTLKSQSDCNLKPECTWSDEFGCLKNNEKCTLATSTTSRRKN